MNIDLSTGISVTLSVIALSYCFYLLVTKKLDTSLTACTVHLSLTGIGWMFFLYQAISGHTDYLSCLGMIPLFLGFVTWSHTQMNISNAAYKLCRDKIIK